MRKIEDFLEPGETISSSKEITDEHGLVDYDIHTVQREGLRDGDEVVLDIGFLSEELVLIGGNPLELQLLGGRGQIIEVNLGTGEKNITNLGVRGKTLHNISPENTLYWYGNPYVHDEFLVRDHCDDFDPKNEPSLQQVTEALIHALRWA